MIGNDTMDDERDDAPSAPDATPSLAGSTLRALRAQRARSAEVTDPPPDTADVEDAAPVEDSAAVEDEDGADIDDSTEVADSAAVEDTAPARTKPARPRPSPSGSAVSTRPRGGTSVAPAITAVLAVAALAFAVVAGVVWWNAGHGHDRTVALARDAALLQARLDIEAVNTSDYRHAPQALDSWLTVSTGSLHDQYAKARTSAISLLRTAKVNTSATVLDAAVTKIDVGKGTATVIASVDVVKRPAKGQASTARNRFSGSMREVHGHWKLADLTLVPVQLT